ncbi:zona pellucida sperm-binding protein 4-like [Bufo gargarizans]|uniref:zona pellucida sperm-binding protein 4-like n=1 Tax=Bufo gargarizans TaxID=30331 RepID=UPI001CF18A92|nr:zona pellucida sperm-binding protein 4-like [Bufo gargarizans]
MGLGKAGMRLVLALLAYGLGSIVCVAQDYWDDPSHLQCGSHTMEISLPSLLEDAAFALSIIDKNGKPHYLHNDSTCGTWIGQKPDGSLVVGSTFNGCYVREENGSYVVTITVEEILRDEKSQYHKKDLACPILPAMDVPSPSDCASVLQADRLACANDSVSQELCEGLGCCFSQNELVLRCYYGKKLTAYCSADNNMVVAISKDVTIPSLILDSVKVLGVDSNSCPSLMVATTASFIGFQFPLSCGSANEAGDASMVYEYTFVATNRVIAWQSASVTRDSTMRVTVSCSFSWTGIVPVQVEVFTLPPPLPVSTMGPLTLEMRIARDVQYSSYYAVGEYPILRVLRDPVHVEVRILQRTDPSLVLILNNCWATSSPEPTGFPQWPILASSCPFAGDNYLTELVPVTSSQGVTFPTYYSRFIVSTFTFVDSNTQTALGGSVFFHCSASVCVPSASETCSVSCQRKRRMVELHQTDNTLTVTSHGPVIFYSKEIQTNNLVEEEKGFGSGLALAWLPGIAVAGFILVVSLLGIYLYRKQKKYALSTVNALIK